MYAICVNHHTIFSNHDTFYRWWVYWEYLSGFYNYMNCNLLICVSSISKVVFSYKVILLHEFNHKYKLAIRYKNCISTLLIKLLKYSILYETLKKNETLKNLVIDLSLVYRTVFKIGNWFPEFTSRSRCQQIPGVEYSHFLILRHHAHYYSCHLFEVNSVDRTLAGTLYVLYANC